MVLRVIDEVDRGKAPARRLSIFHTLLDPPVTDEYKKPKDYEKPSPMQLTDDGVSILVAAAFTTGNAMTLSAYHVLYDKTIYSQLRAEILRNFPHKPEKLDYLSIEKLPYLVSPWSRIKLQVLRLNSARPAVSRKGLGSRTVSSVVFREWCRLAVLSSKGSPSLLAVRLECPAG